jgi:protein AFG1
MRSDDPLEPVALALAAEATLLCFDEFQVTDVADALILRRLFGMLFHHGVVVVATSNRLPKDLYENGINRFTFLPFIDLLEARCEVINVGSPTKHVDYRLRNYKKSSDKDKESAGDKAKESTNNSNDDDIRKDSMIDYDNGDGDGETKKKKNNLTLYYHPFDETSKKAMRKSFEATAAAATGGSTTGGPTEIKVMMGRTLKLPLASLPSKTAYMSFTELCRSPLSPADYLALVEHFHTIYIEDVPELGAQDGFDSARRFINAIDIFYEAHVCIVMSGAKPLDLLFQADAAVSSKNTSVRSKEEDADSTQKEDADSTQNRVHTADSLSVEAPSEVLMRDKGGSSSRLTTFLKNSKGEEVEWSATGRTGVSLAELAGVKDTGFAAHRCVSRLMEMGTDEWAMKHQEIHLDSK